MYDRANMEDPVWLSQMLERWAGELERQPGEGIIWGGDRGLRWVEVV